MTQRVLIKALAMGLTSSVVFGVGGTIAWVRVLLWWKMRNQIDQGGGGLGAVSLGLGETLLLALLGFVLGFGFVIWRARS